MIRYHEKKIIKQIVTFFYFMIKGHFFVFRIYVKDLLAEGAENGSAELHLRKYSVVQADQSYCGEIEVGITFTRKVTFLEVNGLKGLIILVMQKIVKNCNFRLI